ncbi:MAG: type II toxin-antitoxin system HicA family toxin [Calditrichaeota bacterium]|nr:type II toxin-antitoxin system HicA family toxin [Calditrichota bacterium]
MKPISRRDLIYRLKRLGFTGPFAGGRHDQMRRADEGFRIPIPNPHRGDISVDLLKKILRQAGISDAEWESVK